MYSPYILNDPFFERPCRSRQIGTKPRKLCSICSGSIGSDIQFKMFSLPLAVVSSTYRSCHILKHKSSNVSTIIHMHQPRACIMEPTMRRRFSNPIDGEALPESRALQRWHIYAEVEQTKQCPGALLVILLRRKKYTLPCLRPGRLKMTTLCRCRYPQSARSTACKVVS